MQSGTVLGSKNSCETYSAHIFAYLHLALFNCVLLIIHISRVFLVKPYRTDLNVIFLY